jgi:putative addiction module component (TIGR02574 family)
MINVDKSIVGDALSLPASQRVKLVELLLASLDKPDDSLDRLWAEEVENRIDAYESGKLETVSLQRVLSKYK